MKYLRHKTRPQTWKMGKLWDRLVALGFNNLVMWWEPVGPALEMCGHSGGYMVEIDGKTEPFGITIRQALAHANIHAKYVKAFSGSGAE